MTKVNNKKEIENRIIASKFFLRKRFKYLSVLISKTRFLIDDTCDTAYTDGKDVYFSSAFVETLSDEQLNFISLHEMLHIFLLHIKRSNFMGFQFEHETHNEACDYVINLMIAMMGDPKIHVLNNCLLDYQYEGMSTEEVYLQLKKKKIVGEDIPLIKRKGGGGSSGFEDKDTFATTHDKWGQWSDRDLASVKSSIAEGLLKEGAGFGQGIGGFRDVLNEIALETKRDWRETLKNFVFTIKGLKLGTDVQYEERLLGNDIYFIEDVAEDVPENILFAIDVSYSVEKELLRDFLSEVLDCIREFDLHLNDHSKIVFFHSKIEGVFDINSLNSGEDVDTLVDYARNLKGGGTSLELPYDYFEENGGFSGLVMLTDCGGMFPSEFGSVNLIITDNTTADNIPEFADVVYVPKAV